MVPRSRVTTHRDLFFLTYQKVMTGRTRLDLGTGFTDEVRVIISRVHNGIGTVPSRAGVPDARAMA